MGKKKSKQAAKKPEQSVGAFIKESLSVVIWALGIALILRTFLFQPFHIPSSSMEPNLLVGDYIITSKYSVGYGKYAADPLPFPKKKGRLFEREPERGDVLVFKPINNKKTFIKRLAGLPGDQMQMKSGVLHINGKPVTLSLQGQDETQNALGQVDIAERWTEAFPEGHSHLVYDKVKQSPTDNTSVYTVPAGYYFLLGDNRDNSADSRVPTSEGGADYVPAENIIGRAEFVLLSVNEDFSLIKPWTWGNMRGDRFFKGLR
ncbi:MAG: signal peptidase I [Alphaproteobacteria bacterium]